MLRRHMIIALAALGLSPALVLAQPRRRMGPPPPLNAQGEVAKLSMDPTLSLPVISITLGSGEKRCFGIDTGASGYGRIKASTAAGLHLSVLGEAMMADPSGLNPKTVRVFGVPKLTFGEIEFDNVPMEELTMAPAGVDGILGLDFFANYLLTLDRKTSRLELIRGALPEADNVSVFQSPLGPVIRVDVLIGGKSFMADIDTGQARSAFIAPQDWVSSMPLKGDRHSAGIGRTVSQAIEMTAETLTELVYVGRQVLPITEVAWPTPSPVANLGWKAFEGRSLTLDAINRRVQIS